MNVASVLLLTILKLHPGAQGISPPSPAVDLLLHGPVSPTHSLVYRVPDGKRGWYQRGFRRENDGTRDWREYGGLSLEVENPKAEASEVSITVAIPPEPARSALVQSTTARVAITGKGRHDIFVPWTSFDFNQAQPAFLKFVKEVRVSSTSRLSLRSAQAVLGRTVAITGGARGRSTASGGVATYRAFVSNCTKKPLSVTLSFERQGWEAMNPKVEPSGLTLAPGASSPIAVTVQNSNRVPPGGHETQTLRAIAGSNVAHLTFETATEIPHPYVLHTAEQWQEIRDKVSRYPWAKAAQDGYIQRATAWKVPEIARAPNNLTGVDDAGPFVFATTTESDLMDCAIAFALTGDKQFAQKVRTYILRLSDPDRGYPTTLRGCNQSLVQEGHFFQHVALAYDTVAASGLFSEADKAQIERTFRLFIETIEFETGQGSINNWNLAEICGALYCSLDLQDLSLASRFFSGPSGVTDHLGKGLLDDGWWYECAISYNVWSAGEFSQVAIAMAPWGIDFQHMEIPVSYSPKYSLRPFDQGSLYGMRFEKWGPVTHSTANIKRMWDALPNFADYRGVMFGVNDAAEARLGGFRREIAATPYELAYYLYRDPAYAALIKQSGGPRDLLYGVPELPAETPEKFRDSAYADNVGLAMLRSASAGCPDRERIQAALHYGTHGGFHGHFDRTELLHLSRYGRSFFNPEAIWYGYAPFMYKFYVQNSTSKNMVVVDRKMQEPTESRRLLWHTGKLFQATAVETNSRWSRPPYGGMVYPEQGYKTLQEKSFGEGRFLPKPEHEPEYGSVADFTEPILQRRLMIVTDDYVLLADYLKGEQEHTFESVLQMKGFEGIEGATKMRHDAQWDPNPVLDAQFVTDCDWFSANATTNAKFKMRFGPGADNEGTQTRENEPGVLNLDVHSLWPLRQELMIGTAPEDHNVQKRLFWSVRGDGKTLASGQFGAWVLGKADIDVPLTGVQSLTLETRVEVSRRPTVFWGNTRIVTADGKEIPLSQLPVKLENVLLPKEAGKDYFGGPIKLAGEPFAEATPGQPQNEATSATIQINLRGLGAVRFKSTLAGDYPLGNEAQRRKTFASKQSGREARFLTVIEPYEDTSVVISAEAIDPQHIQVRLRDGRVQVFEIQGLEGDGHSIEVRCVEKVGTSVVRSESTNK